LAEKRLDENRWRKWNDNRGGVFNQHGKIKHDENIIVNTCRKAEAQY